MMTFTELDPSEGTETALKYAMTCGMIPFTELDPSEGTETDRRGMLCAAWQPSPNSTRLRVLKLQFQFTRRVAPHPSPNSTRLRVLKLV